MKKERKPLSKGTVRNLGIAATLVGAAAGLLGSFIDDKKNEERISEKVREEVAKALKKED